MEIVPIDSGKKYLIVATYPANTPDEEVEGTADKVESALAEAMQHLGIDTQQYATVHMRGVALNTITFEQDRLISVEDAELRAELDPTEVEQVVGDAFKKWNQGHRDM